MSSEEWFKQKSNQFEKLLVARTCVQYTLYIISYIYNKISLLSAYDLEARTAFYKRTYDL